MDATQQLLELEALRRLKSTYFFVVDTRDREGWLSVWAPDATFQWDTAVSTGGQDGKPDQAYVGHEGLARVFDEMLAHSTSVHHGHCPIIDLISETEARGVWAMEDIVTFPGQVIHGWGHYYETYRKIDGAWKIQTSRLKRLRLEFTHS
jgi:hypothetical protein